jgi:Arc/MetJ family transcription regulator
MGTRKLSVTVDEELVDELQGRVGVRGVSGFVTRAIRHELEREQLGELLADLEGELGPPDEVMMAEAGALFDALGRAETTRPSRARRR